MPLPSRRLRAGRSGKRKGRRSPLGYYLAQLAKGADILATLERAIGAELAARVWQAMLLGELENAVRERERSNVPRVAWRETMRHTDEPALRRFAYFLLLVLERVGIETRKAATKRLYLGPTRDGDQYVPAAKQIATPYCVANRVGVGVRELQRYIAVIEAAGIWQVWQPKEKGALAPANFPEELRGKTYAYNHYRLTGELPRVLRENLEQFYKRNAHVRPPAIDALERKQLQRPPAANTNAEAKPEAVELDPAAADALEAARASYAATAPVERKRRGLEPAAKPVSQLSPMAAWLAGGRKGPPPLPD